MSTWVIITHPKTKDYILGIGLLCVQNKYKNIIVKVANNIKFKCFEYIEDNIIVQSNTNVQNNMKNSDKNIKFIIVPKINILEYINGNYPIAQLLYRNWDDLGFYYINAWEKGKQYGFTSKEHLYLPKPFRFCNDSSIFLHENNGGKFDLHEQGKFYGTIGIPEKGALIAGKPERNYIHLPSFNYSNHPNLPGTPGTPVCLKKWAVVDNDFFNLYYIVRCAVKYSDKIKINQEETDSSLSSPPGLISNFITNKKNKHRSGKRVRMRSRKSSFLSNSAPPDLSHLKQLKNQSINIDELYKNIQNREIKSIIKSLFKDPLDYNDEEYISYVLRLIYAKNHSSWYISNPFQLPDMCFMIH